jgi:hypothetical protein
LYPEARDNIWRGASVPRNMIQHIVFVFEMFRLRRFSQPRFSICIALQRFGMPLISNN